MISINKYGQNLDLTKINEVNGKKSFSISGLDANNTLIINVTKGMKFKSSLEENDLKIEFTDIDGSVFELVLKDMATLLAQNDGQKLVEIIQSNDNKVLASITDITSALEAAAAGPAAGNNTNSDSGVTNEFGTDGLAFENNNYDNARFDNTINGTRVFPDFVANPAPILANPAVTPGIIPINSAPVITVNTTATVNEDEVLTITFTANDIDADILTSSVTATNGTAIINANGDIEFTPNENFNGSAVITLTVNDGTVSTVQTINVTVNPVNDAPILDTITEVAVNEDDSLFSGTITSTDVDNNSTATYTTTSTVAGFVINSDGTYTFDATDNAYQYLAVGQILELTIPITVTDDQGATDTKNLVITITGTNDAPTVTVTPIVLSETDFAALSGYENAYKLITEAEMFTLLGVKDADINDEITISLITDSSDFTSTNTGILNTQSGVVQLTAQNIIDFNLTGTAANVGDFFIYSTGFDGLGNTETSNVKFDVVVSDGKAPAVNVEVNVTVNGVNDAPTVTVTPIVLSETDFAALSGYENAYKLITEAEMFTLLGVKDADINDEITISLITDSSDFTSTNTGILNTQSGVVQLTAQNIIDFNLTGTAANVGDFFIYSTGFDGLGNTETSNVKFDVVVSDGKAPAVNVEVNVTVNGVNDAPTVTVTPIVLSETDFAALSGYENAYKLITEAEMFTLLGVKDADINDEITISLITDSSDFTSTNTGILNTQSGVVQLTAQNIIDFNLTGTAANVGDFFIYSTGFDGLGNTETSNVKFDVVVSDGKAPAVNVEVNVTVNGVNDAPTVTVTPIVLSETDFAALSGYENAYKLITEAEMFTLLGVKDADINDEITISLITDSSDFTSTNTGILNTQSGVVQLTAQNIIDFNLTGTAANVGDFFIYSTGFDGLGNTETSNVKFDVVVSDGKAPAVNVEVNVTVNGVNDAPTVTVTPIVLSETDFAALSGYENAYKLITEAEMFTLLGVKDADINDEITISLITDSSDFTSTNTGILNTQSGVVQLTAQNIIDFNLTGTAANVGDFFIYSTGFDGLGNTETSNVKFDVVVSDGKAPAVNVEVNVTVNGVNDAPTVTVTPIVLSETDFAALSGYENAYKLITEAEMFTLLGVKDADINDEITISLITDSSDFTSTNTGILNTQSGVVQLTAQNIIDFNLTGTAANVGDFFIYSTGFDGLGNTETSNVKFDVVVSDGKAPAVNVEVNVTVNGVNDAPTVTVTPIVLSETDFAALSGYENAYKLITEAEMFTLLGVKDADINDEITISLITDSSDFTSTNTGILNTQSGVVQLTAQNIIDFNLTGTAANVGDFFIYSTGFDGLGNTETSNVKFDVVVSDGKAPAVNVEVNVTVNGVNDAPTVTVTPIVLSETDFAALSGYENAYKLITEAEMFTLLGVKDADINDEITISLITDSSDFTSTNTGILNTQSGVVQLTAQNIIDFNLTGTAANVGDFFIYSTGFDGLGNTETSNVKFDVVVSDGKAPAVNVEVNVTVNGVNDAPTVTVTPIVLSETDFAALSGYENAYKLITEAEMFTLLGVKDADINDEITISLITDSSDFTSTNTGILNTQSGVVQLTAQNIIDFNLTGTAANVGDFFIYSTGFDGLGNTETSNVKFDVVVSDGKAPAVNVEVNVTVNGVNDAPTVTVTPIVLSETDFAALSGYENAYKLITEAEMFTLLGVKDADINDEITISLITDSSDFTSTNTGILNTQSGVVQLTAQNIIDFNLTGTAANVGDFFIYSTGFDGLGNTETSNVKFDVVVSDGKAPAVNVEVNVTVNGVNDAPTVTVTPIVLSETDFAALSGYENAYKLITEAEMFTLLGVKDADINDEITISLITDSSDFTSTNTGILNTQSGVVQLTAQNIIDFNLTGTAANVGDFFIYSTGFDGLGNTETSNVKFDVVVSDGKAPAVNVEVNVTVNGVNDAPTVNAVTMNTIENDLSSVNGKDNVRFTDSLVNEVKDADINDTHTFERVGSKLGLTIETTNSGLVHAFANNQINYMKVTALKLFAIPEIAAVLSSVTDMTILGLINQVKSATTVSQLLTIVNNIPGISAEINSPGALKLQIEDAKILEQSNLLKVIVNTDGSYTVESPLFNNLSVTDTVSLSFDYRAKDSAGVYSNTEKVTVNVVGSNDALTTNDVTISVSENELANTNNTILTVGIDSNFALNNYTYDKDVLDDFNYERANAKVGLTISTTSSGLFYAFKDNQIEYIRDVALKLFAIPEIKTVLNSITDINALTFINQLKAATSVPALLLLVKSIGINLDLDLATKTIKLQIEDARILEQNGLLKITIEGDGSYSVESPLFNNLSVVDTVSLSFEYIATDSGGATTLPKVITLNVTGSNDALTTKDVTININENDLKSNNTTLTVGIDSQYALNNNTLDVDVLDDADYHRSGEKLGLTISTTDTGLLTAVASNDLAYVKSVVLKLILIPEVSLVLNSIKDVNILTLINTLKSASSLTQLLGMVNSIDGIKIGMDTTTGTLKLEVADAKILEKNNLVKIDIVDNGSYTVESPLFNNLSPNDKVSLSFDYIGTDSGGATTEPKTITLNVTGTNDSPTANISATIVSSKAVSYVGQLVANDVDINDKVTYSYDKSSVSMTFAMDGLNNINSLLALNNPLAIQALGELKTVGMNFVNNGNILALTTLSSQTIATSKVAISVLKDFLDSNVGLKGDIISLKNFILANKEAIVAHTSIVAQDIVLLETLITENNIIALGKIFDSLQTFVSDPIAKAAITSILADNVISPAELAYLAPYQAQIEALRLEIKGLVIANPSVVALLDIPTIISKLQEVFTFDAVNSEVSAHINVPSSIAEHIIVLDANTGEYTINNPYLSSLPDSTQVEINFNYKATDSFGATDSSTASILITSENVAKVSASLDDNGSLTFGDEKEIDMGSLLSNITSNMNVSDIDSIDLSSNEHILSNLTIADFEEMVSDTASSTLSIKGENDDIVKLDLTNIWKKDIADTDLNSVVDTLDDNFIAYTATGTHNQVLTLLIDKDIIVQDI